MSSTGGALRGGRGRGGGGGWGHGGGRGGGGGSGGGGGGGGRGRGAYYKALYGGGGGGGGNPKRARIESDDTPSSSGGGGVQGRTTWTDRPWTALEDFFSSREGASYPAYKDLLGHSWTFPPFAAASTTKNGWALRAHSIQSDPFAPPSHFEIRVPHAVSQLPAELWEGKGPSRFRLTALADFFLRALGESLRKASLQWEVYASAGGGGGGSGWNSAKGGQLEIDGPGQQVLDRSAVRFGRDGIQARFRVGLPARGRSILGRQAYHLLTTIIPAAVEDGLRYTLKRDEAIWTHIAALEDSYALTSQLHSQNLVAFIGNGSILPRASGASDKPMRSAASSSGEEDGAAVEFVSPGSLETEMRLPHRGPVRGLGIEKGTLTVLIGGGFHGKSTLLEALSRGSYVHVPGDGRELVRTAESTVLIQSEDGRCVKNVDISPFIKNLPSGKPTTRFSTTNASGSTSCSASLVEAIELGSEFILIDEDTTAANWLQREVAMSQLVPNEPISPFVEHVRELVGRGESSVVIVCGSSTAFLRHADHVLLLDSYRIKDVTLEARKLFPRSENASMPTFPVSSRSLDLSSFPKSDGGYKGAFEVPRGTRVLRIRDDRRTTTPTTKADEEQQQNEGLPAPSDEDLSLQLSRCVPQLVHPSQARAIAAILNQLRLRAPEWTGTGSDPSLRGLVDSIDALFEGEDGIEMLQDRRGGVIQGDWARPRKVDIGAVINRLRVVQLK